MGICEKVYVKQTYLSNTPEPLPVDKLINLILHMNKLKNALAEYYLKMKDLQLDFFV